MNTIPKIKVCGMRQAKNIREVAALKPDYMGLIFYDKSARSVKDDKVEGILNAFPKKMPKVGVFVNELIHEVFRKLTLFDINIAQLHGDEPPLYCEELQQLDVKVVKAFRVGSDFDFATLEKYKPFCDYFLFDTQTEKYGGSGKKFDWSILKHYDNEKPIFLSGGIGSDDAKAIQELNGLNVHAIDINSKFETEPGMKNVELLSKFINDIRKI